MGLRAAAGRHRAARRLRQQRQPVSRPAAPACCRRMRRPASTTRTPWRARSPWPGPRRAPSAAASTSIRPSSRSTISPTSASRAQPASSSPRSRRPTTRATGSPPRRSPSTPTTARTQGARDQGRPRAASGRRLHAQPAEAQARRQLRLLGLHSSPIGRAFQQQEVLDRTRTRTPEGQALRALTPAQRRAGQNAPAVDAPPCLPTRQRSSLTQRGTRLR